MKLGIKKVVIIDKNEGRRARISFLLQSLNYSTDFYDSADHMSSDLNLNTIIFAHANSDNSAIKQLMSANDRAGVWCPIVLYGENPTANTITSAIFAGALDFIVYPFASDDLIRCIERIVHRSTSIESARRVCAHARHLIAKLSPRERDVLSGLVGEMGNKEIGTGLGISARTVEIHRSNLMRKLGAHSVVGAVTLALASGEFYAI